MKLLVTGCMLVALATTAQAESHAEMSARLYKATLEMIKKSQQLKGEINSVLGANADNIEMILEKGLTQEMAELGTNYANDPLWREFLAYEQMFKKTSQHNKNNLAEMSRYLASGEMPPQEVLNKYQQYAMHVLKLLQKQRALLMQLERKHGASKDM